MTLRRLFFWLHLSVGLVAGLLIGALALTGSLLAFEPQLIAAAERSSHAGSPAGGSCVAPSVLLANAAAVAHHPPASLTLFTDPRRPAQLGLGQDGSVLLADACTGRILGPGANRLRVFLNTVQELHHTVALAGVRHQTLRAIKNAAALLFVLLILSGLYVWFPRQLTWQHLRPSVFFRPGLRGRAREWNLHTLAGFWLCLPLLAISVTGVIMAFPWANNLLFRAAGETPPPPRRDGPPSAQAAEIKADRGSRGRAPATSSGFTSLDAPIARALGWSPTATAVSFRLPRADARSVLFQISQRDRPAVLRDGLTLALPDAAVLKWEPLSAATRGRRWRTDVRFLHTGELLGAPGQAVALLATLSALLLVWTGFSLSLRRLAAFRRRRRAARGAPSEVPATQPVRVG